MEGPALKETRNTRNIIISQGSETDKSSFSGRTLWLEKQFGKMRIPAPQRLMLCHSIAPFSQLNCELKPYFSHELAFLPTVKKYQKKSMYLVTGS